MDKIKETAQLLFPDEEELKKTPSQRFNDQIRNEVFAMRKRSWSRINPQLKLEVENELKINDIAAFISEHVKNVGREQAMRDLQTGLNLLNKNFKVSIKEDGNYGKNTHSALSKAIKFYSLRAIKMYIRRGIINNLIFDTKNNPQINTSKEVNAIGRNLIIESRK